MASADENGDGRGVRRAFATVLLLGLALTVVWWAVVRATASSRALNVHPSPTVATDTAAPGTGAAPGPDAPASATAVDTVRVLAWNIAHARGDLRQGSLQNFRAGDAETRAARLARIAAVIRESRADVVVLNEVDFDAAWSRGLNQAEVLARSAGYPTRVEQRNFDYSVLLADFAFGNAVLTRLPIRGVRRVPLPPLRRVESVLLGAKTAAVVELATAAGPVAVVPIHLEFRSETVRLAAVEPLEALQDDAPPLVLAGDFNTSPPGWPGAEPPTAVGELLEEGWRSPRALGAPGAGEPTFPSPDPRRAIDWVLVEPPLRVLESRVLTGHARLSDHLPVLAVVEVGGPPDRSDGSDSAS